LDAGTGIRRAGAVLGSRPFLGTVLLTHLHWDHTQGIPFFQNGDRQDARVDLFLPPQDDGLSAEGVLERMMSPPFFPILPGDLRGKWTFGVLPSTAFSDQGFVVEGFQVMAREVPHKGGRTVGYRVSDGRSAIAYIPDHCPTLLGPGPDGLGEYHPAAVELAQGADILIHDANLLLAELAEQASFGHAAADYAVSLGERSGAKKVVLFHHRQDRNDDAIDELVKSFSSSAVRVVGAADDLEFQL
jgi:phosphoribosyl 1,2-cyclic phosphodiesterase